MVSRPDFAFYQTYLQVGLGELEHYLLADDLFWSVSISSASAWSYPNLTLGGLLLYLIYARILAVTPSQRTSYHKIENQLETLRTRWRVAWERKASWEYQSRLRQWSRILNDIRDVPQENAPFYRSEVRIRVILALLTSEGADIDLVYKEELKALDFLLRALFQPTEFIWDAELAPAFPEDEYWFLWGTPGET